MEAAHTAWERQRIAAEALQAAINEYANSLYDHNVNERCINPLGAYRDAKDTLTLKVGSAVNEALFDLQFRVADAA